jgi:hypothetical protein
MPDGVRSSRGILVLAVVALAAEWLGHAVTWWLTGGAEPGHALSGSLHAYLQPLGVTLGLAAVVATWLVVDTARRLSRHARRLRATLTQGWRLDAAPDDPLAAALGDRRFDPSCSPGPAQLGAGAVVGRASILFAVQVIVYLVQENVEARAVGLGWPGLHVLSAHHGSALMVHAAVALAAATVLVMVSGRLIRRRGVVARLAALASRIRDRRRRVGRPGWRPTLVWTGRWPLAAALDPRPPPRTALT